MSSTSASALPIAAIPVERFVERLYAALAWDATVRLGDPAIASRLVERVLHRAWDERERFATFDALYRHAQDAALAAIATEADRRRDVTRFDDTAPDAPVPGSLESMSVDAVRRRIGEGRKPVATPPQIAAVMAPVVVPAPAVAETPAPPARTEPMAAPARSTPTATPRPVPKPRISMAGNRVDEPRASQPVPAARPSRPTTRRTGSFTAMSGSEPSTLRLTETQKRAGLAGAAVVLLLGVIAVASSRGGGDPQARAFAALADTTGATHRTAHAATEEIPLADSSIARLGADASIAMNADFGDGARALRVSGPVSVALRRDSSALAAIQVGEHRFVTAGTVAAFATNAAGLVLVQVDSGDLVLVRDSARVRLIEGSVVRIGSGTPMPLTRDQRDAAFGWRLGRLQLAGESLKGIAAAARQWYDVDVRFPAGVAMTDTASLDVPLASRDSLVSALESALRARAEVTGDRIVLRSAGAATPAPRRATAAPVVPLLAPPNFDPRIPPLE